jgi:hypothetical protein
MEIKRIFYVIFVKRLENYVNVMEFNFVEIVERNSVNISSVMLHKFSIPHIHPEQPCDIVIKFYLTLRA